LNLTQVVTQAEDTVQLYACKLSQSLVEPADACYMEGCTADEDYRHCLLCMQLTHAAFLVKSPARRAVHGAAQDQARAVHAAGGEDAARGAAKQVLNFLGNGFVNIRSRMKNTSL